MGLAGVAWWRQRQLADRCCRVRLAAAFIGRSGWIVTTILLLPAAVICKPCAGPVSPAKQVDARPCNRSRGRLQACDVAAYLVSGNGISYSLPSAPHEHVAVIIARKHTRPISKLARCSAVNTETSLILVISSAATYERAVQQHIALTGRNTTGPPCSRATIIRLEAA